MLSLTVLCKWMSLMAASGFDECSPETKTVILTRLSFAGSDSTASTMQSFFYQILSDKRVYAKIQEEFKNAVADGTIPSSGNVSWIEAQNLPYFQACMKEAMRVRPAVGLNITRMVPPEGAELDGIKFPGGVSLAVNGWVLHRDRATFGEDADVYRPERWLGDPEEARRMERYMFQVSLTVVLSSNSRS